MGRTPGWLRIVLRGLLFLGLTGGTAVATVGCAGCGLGAVLWRARAAGTCLDLPHEDLTLREMGQLRRRLDDYRDSRKPIPLAMTGREAAFLLRDQFHVPAWIGADGTSIQLLASVPRDAGGTRCWNLTFKGHVELEDRVMSVDVEELRVGRLDLTGTVDSLALSQWLVSRAPAPAGELASHLVTLQIADGTLFVRVDDRGILQ